MGTDSPSLAKLPRAPPQGGFEAMIGLPRPRPLYLLGLVAVSVAMVLLPLIYVGFIAAVAGLTYWHATEHAWLLARPSLLGVLAYVSPLVAGAVVVIFMIKPVFARRRTSEISVAVEPAHAPRLYAFAGAVAACLGAPAPRTIEVAIYPNAAASFQGGLRGVIRGRLVLTVGLPLVGGLDTRQLAGVIAHELGHFSQRAGMRLTWIVRTINAWFLRVVYERDAWDDQLARLGEDGGSLVAGIGALARFGVWLGRGILWALMWIGHAIGCLMLRQMEYDADRCEIRLAGSDAFASTIRRLGQLVEGAARAERQLDAARAAHRLPDDVPGLVVSNADCPPPPGHLESPPQRRRTRLFDTHPSDEARLARARAEAAPGVYRVEAPAAGLLDNFDVLCKWVTLACYRRRFGNRVRVESLVPLTTVTKQQQAIDFGERAARRYFQGLLNPWRPWVVADALDDIPVPVPGAVPGAGAALADLRTRLLACAGAGRQALDGCLHAINDLAHARQVARLLGAGFQVDLASLPLPTADRTGLDAVRRRAEQTLADVDRVLRPVEDIVVARLRLALGLLRRPAAESRAAAGALAANARRALEGLRAWREIAPELPQLHDRSTALSLLLGGAVRRADDEVYVDRVRRTAEDIHRHLNHLHAVLRHADDPLAHAEGERSMATVAIGAPPVAWDVSGLHETARASLDKLLELYARMMGRLALVAERVEKACGLAPLPDPVLSPAPAAQRA